MIRAACASIVLRKRLFTWLWVLPIVLASPWGFAQGPRSGYLDMSPSTRALQDDDAVNPAMLWVKQGQALYAQSTAGIRSCSSCHQEVTTLKGVATRFPKFDERLGRPLTLSQRINQCRIDHQASAPWPPASSALLSLEALIALQSRGETISGDVLQDKRLQSVLDQGKALYEQPMGQLNMACTQCHDQYAGKKLGSAVIPQGHPNGYPLYRLEWQELGSLQRRLRNCMSGVRAVPFAYDSAEMAALELFLKKRAVGLRLEAPALRP
jgi:L-cysteine S-thiosulfotransferase